MKYLKILVLVFFQIFGHAYANTNLPLKFKIKELGQPNQLFYISLLIDEAVTQKIEKRIAFAEIRKQNNLNSEASLFLKILEFDNDNSYHKSSEEQYLNFYNQNLEEVRKINSPLLSIGLYHIPIEYYENNYNVKYQKQLIYFYQRIYWLLKHNPELKHSGIEVEILRITNFYFNIGNFQFVKDVLQEHYDRTSFNSQLNPKTNFFTLYHCNSLALSYFELRELDKAKFFYELGIKKAKYFNSLTWVYIFNANLAEIYYYKGRNEIAKQMFLTSIDSLKNKGVDNILAFSYIYLSEIYLLENNMDKAYENSKKAYPILKTLNENKRWLIYYNLMYKMALLSNNIKLVSNLKDSITKYEINVKRNSSSFNSEELSLSIMTENNDLQLKMKKNEIIRIRTYVVFGILLISIMAYYNYKKMANKINKIKKEKEEINEKNKNLENQLQQLIQEIIDKNNAKISQEINWEQFKLLTKEEWQKFLLTFTELHPNFISQIEINGIQLTEAEKRMAILIKLKIENKTMASMLGISETSVWQSKARLKKKLNLDTNIQLDKFILES